MLFQTRNMIRAAFQGEPGAYSEKAVKEVFEISAGIPVTANIETVPCSSFEDTFAALVNGEVDYAVIPIENSLGGSIHANFDLLTRYRDELSIVGEIILPIHHCLLSLPGTTLSDITHIISHPQALAQCREYIDMQFPTSQHNPKKIQVKEVYDTAGSAKMIQTQSLKNYAAIASDLAAQLYNLDILCRNIEDCNDNTTRFLVLQRTDRTIGDLPHRTVCEFCTTISVVLKPPNTATNKISSSLRDPLVNILSAMQRLDLSITKIESRPIPASLKNRWQGEAESICNPFRYILFMDIRHSLSDSTAATRIKFQSELTHAIADYVIDFHCFGTYAEKCSIL